MSVVLYFISSKVQLIVICVVLVSWTAAQQQYTLVVQRDQYPGIRLRWNQMRLNCRDSNFEDHPDYFFWVNSTQNDLRKITSYTNSTIGLIFTIDPTMEGKYFCGPDMLSSSPKLPLVAYPIPSSAIQPKTVRATVDMPITIEPLVAPGALLAQYYIDWMNATSSEVLARIDGPRSLSQQPIDPAMKYSVDPVSFELTINSVSYEDQGLYLSVVSVVDPAGMDFVYEQTETFGIMLEVYVSPSFVRPPTDTVVSIVNQRSVIYTCDVLGSPTPVIQWFHNDVDCSMMPSKYEIRSTATEGGVSVVGGVLTIYSLDKRDSGYVTCVAMVTFDDEQESVRRSANLSVLGEFLSMDTFITTKRGVIFNVHLQKALSAEVQLYLTYTDTHTGDNWNRTTANRYKDSEVIAYFESNAPFDQFTVEAALVSGSIKGPVYQDPRSHDVSLPTCSELHATLVQYLVPTLGAILGLIILTIVIVVGMCMACCRTPCMHFCFNINSEGSQNVLVESRLQPPPVTCPSGAAGGAPDPNQKHDDSVMRKSWWKIWCTRDKKSEEKAADMVERVRQRVKNGIRYDSLRQRPKTTPV